MKYKNIVCLWISVFLLGLGCDDYLDLNDPTNLNADNYWRNEADVKNTALAMYAMLTPGSWRYHEYYIGPGILRGDDVLPLYEALRWDYIAAVPYFSNRPANPCPDIIWNKMYDVIGQANQILRYIDGVTGMDEAAVNRYKAEVRAMRAYAHYELLRNFRQIVIADSDPDGLDKLNRPLSSREGSWNFVVRELSEAAPLLPKKWSDDQYGRITSGAAMAFLGTAYLYQGNKMKEAEQTFKSVIADYDYELDDEFARLFDGSKETSNEIIFAQRFTADKNGTGYKYNNMAVANYTSDDGGWYMWRPSDFLMESFREEKTTDGKYDKRMFGTVLWSEENVDVVFDGEPYTSSKTCFRKYTESKQAVSSMTSYADYITMRYADVLLMLAEALTEQNKAPEAVPYLDQVRERAGLSKFGKTDTESVRAEIRRQRLLEFALESKRFYDLVRWGIVKEQLTEAKHIGAAAFVKGKHEYFPVPLSETNNNPKIDPDPNF